MPKYVFSFMILVFDSPRGAMGVFVRRQSRLYVHKVIKYVFLNIFS